MDFEKELTPLIESGQLKYKSVEECLQKWPKTSIDAKNSGSIARL
jgi:hypothetical protein